VEELMRGKVINSWLLQPKPKEDLPFFDLHLQVTERELWFLILGAFRAGGF
jgi:hypothetical protein